MVVRWVTIVLRDRVNSMKTECIDLAEYQQTLGYYGRTFWPLTMRPIFRSSTKIYQK
jgi:hypothetical protein